MIIARYIDDAERKRIEYAFDRWKDSMEIRKPEGIAVIVKGEKVEDMLNDLYARTSKDNVSVYNLSETSFDLEENEKRIKIELEGDIKTVEKLMDFVMAKQKAIFRREFPSGKLYEVYTKKGRAEIVAVLKEREEKVGVDIKITGYGEAPDLVYNKISNELKYLREV